MTRSSRSLASSAEGWKGQNTVSFDVSWTIRPWTAERSYQVAVVSHDVILHPRWRLQLLATVLTGERLLHMTKLRHMCWLVQRIHYKVKSFQTVSAHQSAVLHVFLQPLHCLPAHTFTFWTGDSAFGHNLELPTLLLTPWWRSSNKNYFIYVYVNLMIWLSKLNSSTFLCWCESANQHTHEHAVSPGG